MELIKFFLYQVILSFTITALERGAVGYLRLYGVQKPETTTFLRRPYKHGRLLVFLLFIDCILLSEKKRNKKVKISYLQISSGILEARLPSSVKCILQPSSKIKKLSQRKFCRCNPPTIPPTYKIISADF